MRHLTIAEAAKAAKVGRYPRQVATAVIPGLIESGKIRVVTVEGEPRVVDDEAFRSTMRLGIERFVAGRQGWCFLAVDAPIDHVAAYLKARPGVVAYEPDTPVGPTRDELGYQPGDGRDYFLVGTASGSWSVLLQTIHWVSGADIALAVLLAAEISSALRTSAVAAWDDDFSGATLLACREGRKAEVLSDCGTTWASFHRFFYERGIALPECFISNGAGGAQFHAKPAREITRADHVSLEIPPRPRPREAASHAANKVNFFAMAAGAGAKGEDAYSIRVADGLWEQAQEILGSRDTPSV